MRANALLKKAAEATKMVRKSTFPWMKASALALSSVLLFAPAAPAFAGSRDFTLHNQSSHPLWSVFIWPSGFPNDELGIDECVSDTDAEACNNLETNQSVRKKVDADVFPGVCVFDIQAVYGLDSFKVTETGINLCATHDVTFNH
jgi:hypothetical protein